MVALIGAWAMCATLTVVGSITGRLDESMVLPLVIVGAASPALAFAGWRDERDQQRRNVAATIAFLDAPLLCPLTFVVFDADVGWTVPSWFGAIVLSLFGATIRAHPMPGPGRVLFLLTALALSSIGGLFAMAIPGVGV